MMKQSFVEWSTEQGPIHNTASFNLTVTLIIKIGRGGGTGPKSRSYQQKNWDPLLGGPIPSNLRLFLVHRAALKTHSSQNEDTFFGAIRKGVRNVLLNKKQGTEQ